MIVRPASRRPATVLAGLALAGLGLAALAGCATSSTSSAPEPTPSFVAGQQITVFAAASLAGPFDQIGAAFESAHPGSDVKFSYAGSSDLVSQLAAGAPADVLATADERTMKQATDKALVPQPRLFATNELAILVRPGNPLGIVGARDLAHPDVQLVVCAPQVPCGAATQRTLQAAGISITPVSEEPNVTDTAGKVTSGQADAAVVYTTDVAKAEATRTGTGVPLGIDQTPNRYPIGVTAAALSSNRAELADQFVSYVTGAEGQAVLQKAGFGRP
ncbi:molybdate transport system substrate-binding protein [Raineyella antarctica]|uniref:Molybdate transport system substrate-binding protein n=1 Tax=Raineyella antarctica TaxID=1577474 RepID=A0A1G6H9Q3_9ACTN|nr:molybdate ABC transporter substrate-binding protein [Raineyella antarctica]SDB90675.1 molybdate transport system substrate-binding protein [Raineyella antarctica]